MRVLPFLRRILKRALADVGKASGATAGTNANKMEQLHSGNYWQPRKVRALVIDSDVKFSGLRLAETCAS